MRLDRWQDGTPLASMVSCAVLCCGAGSPPVSVGPPVAFFEQGRDCLRRNWLLGQIGGGRPKRGRGR